MGHGSSTLKRTMRISLIVTGHDSLCHRPTIQKSNYKLLSWSPSADKGEQRDEWCGTCSGSQQSPLPNVFVETN